MSPFKSMGRLICRRSLQYCQRFSNCSNRNQIRRCLSSIGGSNPAGTTVGRRGCKSYSFLADIRCLSSTSKARFHTRQFMGCNDGEEGDGLSKVYEERRVLGYSPEQLFNVAAAVDFYEDFVPYCQRSRIICRNPDGSFDAELQIGFKFLVESYVSHVELNRPNSIKTTSTQNKLFDHLINVWEFNPGPVPGTCSLYFLVDFKFQSPIYGQVSNMFFKEVINRLVGSFSDRCRLLYGPAVPVIEKNL